MADLDAQVGAALPRDTDHVERVGRGALELGDGGIGVSPTLSGVLTLVLRLCLFLSFLGGVIERLRGGLCGIGVGIVDQRDGLLLQGGVLALDRDRGGVGRIVRVGRADEDGRRGDSTDETQREGSVNG